MSAGAGAEQPGPLAGRRIVLGVSGSIAAYRAFEVARRLEQAGALVDVALTPDGDRFAPAATFRNLVRGDVAVDMFADYGQPELHVEMGRRADLLLAAPASATTLAKLAHGIADNMLTLTALATAAPLVLAPAMDAQMYAHPAVQANVRLLEQRGAVLVGPVEGRLASGRVGLGRLAEPEEIVGAARAVLGRAHGDLRHRSLVISAGGTREAIDPVRYVGNRSSGKMGFALAEAARDRGAVVMLVTTQPPPPGLFGVTVDRVESAREMLETLQERVAGADALIMAAAVADYRPEHAAERKIKKAGDGAPLEIRLTENPDILATLPGPYRRVGFAAESQDLLENARAKLLRKGLDLIVANDITREESGFGADTNCVVILSPDQPPEALPVLPKYQVAQRVLDRLAPLLRSR